MGRGTIRARWAAPAVLGAMLSGCGSASPPSAADLLAGALEKLGPAPPALTMKATGTLNHAAELQGSRPGATDESRLEETLGWDSSGHVVHEVVMDRLDGSEDWVREVYDIGTKTIHVMADSFSVELSDHPEVSGRERLRRRFPRQLILAASAAESLVQLDPVGDTAVIRANLGEGATVDLHIGPDSLLSGVAYTGQFPARGETQVRWEFGDYRVEDVGPFPYQYSIVIDGAQFIDMTVHWVTDDPARVAGLVEPPAGFGDPIQANGSGGPDANAAVEDLGDGLYRVTQLRTGFHPAFIEFSDFVVIVDAPAGYPLMLELPAGDVAPGPAIDWLSQRFRELIQETVGDKPIRHVVLTHFHNDHAGGVTAFLEPGITVHAPPGDTAAIRSFLLTQGQGSIQLMGVSQGERITDGDRILDLIQIGPNPHTHEMLVAYLHDPSTLVMHDLIPGVTVEQLLGPDLTPTQAFFIRWLARSALVPERLLTIHSLDLVDLRRLGGD